MKKIISIILSLALVLLLIGCNSSTDSSSLVQGNSSVTEIEEIEWYTKGDIEITSTELNAALSKKYVKPKNVIVLIGDGMGLNDLELAKRFSNNLFEFGLVIDSLPNKGFATTHNVSGELTDSAASATALATGYKTTNGTIGLDAEGNVLKNVSEIARENGKKVGIVASDWFTGATPSGFTVHNSYRGNAAEIAKSFLDFTPDVLIGDGYSDFATASTSIDHIRKMTEIMLANEFEVFEERLDKDLEKPFFGFAQFDLERDIYQLANCTEIALKRLENENGFFLMVESCGTDKGGHENSITKKLTGVATLDRVAAVAVKYCAENPDTLLIITSDHETGGVTLTSDASLSDNVFTTTNHTNTNVGIFALGYGTEIFNGKTVDNTDIAKFVINAVSQ